ncbi:MAG: MmcQ/YjbR family DNA-binding protein [Bacillota bacterium]|nr:MmcQ/YjbR family DNA-binding protein [Bacillota bacterium]
MKSQGFTRNDIFQYAKESFGTIPEFLWRKSPNYAVLRHSNNSKWYAVIMDVPGQRLGLTDSEKKDILNVKCPPMLIDAFLNREGFLPAYHMNKRNWLSILLDGTVPNKEILDLLSLSFDMTES